MTSAHEATVDHQAVAGYARLCGHRNRVHPDATLTVAIIVDPHRPLALTGEAVIAFPREEAP